MPRPPPGVLRARPEHLRAGGRERIDLAEQLDLLATKVDERLEKAGAEDVAAEEITPAAVGGVIRPNEWVVLRFERYCERKREERPQTRLLPRFRLIHTPSFSSLALAPMMR